MDIQTVTAIREFLEKGSFNITGAGATSLAIVRQKVDVELAKLQEAEAKKEEKPKKPSLTK